ncbi:MAG: hypothetical protein JEZ00_13060 [Anaerolineaceae bacterium]|nr:hypothetical protein [Anaerolineaceae bacterium]
MSQIKCNHRGENKLDIQKAGFESIETTASTQDKEGEMMSQKELDFLKNVFSSQYFDQNLNLDFFVEKNSENAKDGSYVISVIDERDFPPTVRYSRYRLSAKELPVKSQIEILKVHHHGVDRVEYDATFHLIHVYYEHKPAITITKVPPLWFNSLRFAAMKNMVDVVDLINRATRIYKSYQKDEIKIETT